MKKKNGFTLIELLAVIVILAIIALIAVPVMLKVIDNAERKAFEDTAYGVIEAVKLAYTEDVANEVKTLEKTYDLSEKTLKLSGEKPKGGNASINENGKISIAIYDKKQKYCAIKNTNEEKVTVKDFKGSTCDNGKGPDPTPDVKDEAYQNGTAIYYNPETNQKCTENEAKDSHTTGVKTGCMKWYIFNDKVDATTVNMILEHSTTSMVQWNKNHGDTMEEAKTALLNDTSTWNNGLNARVITANEVAQITGNTSFDAGNISSCGLQFYFDSKNNTQSATSENPSKYAWLFDYTDNCTTYGCNKSETTGANGYWINTVDISGMCGVAPLAFYVGSQGFLGMEDTYYNYGIRPVITVQKTIID